MKLPHIHREAFITLCIGIIIGTGVGMYLFALSVPTMISNGTITQMGAGMYDTDDSEATLSMMRRGHGGYSGYGDVRSDMMMQSSAKQAFKTETAFLQAMIAHDQVAVGMAAQALTMRLSSSTKTLANQIIANQTDEISAIQDIVDGR